MQTYLPLARRDLRCTTLGRANAPRSLARLKPKKQLAYVSQRHKLWHYRCGTAGPTMDDRFRKERGPGNGGRVIPVADEAFLHPRQHEMEQSPRSAMQRSALQPDVVAGGDHARCEAAGRRGRENSGAGLPRASLASSA